MPEAFRFWTRFSNELFMNARLSIKSQVEYFAHFFLLPFFCLLGSSSSLSSSSSPFSLSSSSSSSSLSSSSSSLSAIGSSSLAASSHRFSVWVFSLPHSDLHSKTYVLFHVVWNASYFRIEFSQMLHYQMGVVSFQIMEHHWYESWNSVLEIAFVMGSTAIFTRNMAMVSNFVLF